MLIHRFGDLQQDNYFNYFLDAAKKYKGACDEVWLATMYGYPKFEYHKKHANLLNEYARVFRENGIKVSLQVSNTIGHGQYMSSRDCSGLVYEGSKVGNMVGYNGKSSRYCFCYNDRTFIDYIKTTLNEYAILKPDAVWIDDDLRLMWHDPVDCGCFCDHCISMFNKQYNYEFDREELVSQITKDSKVRDDYTAFIKESVGNFVEEVCTDFHKLSPDSNFGHQNASITFATGGNSYIFSRMEKVTGKKPCFRPGGGAYNDACPDTFIEKYIIRTMGIAQSAKDVSVIAPETENTPFTAYGGKSHYGTCLETSMGLAGGANAMSYSIMMDLHESIDYYQETFRLFSQHRKYWETLIELNNDTHQAGIDYVMPFSSGKRNIENGESLTEYFSRWFDIHHYYLGLAEFLKTGLPVSFGNTQAKVKILKYDCAKCLTKEELTELLKEPCLCDVQAFKYLSEKYDCFNALPEAIDPMDGHKFSLKYANDCIFPELANKYIPTQFLFHDFTRIIPKDDDYIALAEFETSSKELLPSEGKYPYGIAECIVKTSQGGQWAVFGSNLWNPTVNHNRKIFFEKLYEYFTNEKIDVSVLNVNPTVTLPRANNENKLTSVSILNCSLDEIRPEIVINNPNGTNFFVIDKNGKEKAVKSTPFNGGYKLKLPKLNSYHMQTVIVRQ